MPAQPGQFASRADAEAIDRRVSDLLDRMTLPEKAGLMFHTKVAVVDPHMGHAALGTQAAEHLISDLHLTHLHVLGAVPDARAFAHWHNQLQDIAAETRLGIPITFSSDPRHAFTHNPATAATAGAFSQWPETLGFGALRDPDLVAAFADIARREYLAAGLRLALHPQVDVNTEPRWARGHGGFSEDADLTATLGAAYIRGFQGAQLGPDSVATVTKHFPGGGPQKDGEDPHFAYGKEQIYPGGNFDYHLRPFRVAIAAGANWVMPYYGMPVGTPYEQVGFGFNRDIITTLLRESLGYQGIVLTDWTLITDSIVFGERLAARAWGVEHLDDLARAQKIIDAGCDQFGGEARPDLIVQLVHAGRVSTERINESVRRLLTAKFVLGLFDQRHVDPDHAAATIGRADFAAAGADAQRRSHTLLTNQNDRLPLATGHRLYIEGINPDAAAGYGQVVDRVENADVAIIRIRAPYETRPGGLQAHFHAGSLEYPRDQQTHHLHLCASVPTIVGVYLDRPAVLTHLVNHAAAIIAGYGSTDHAFLDVVFGRATPEGRLPFDLPRSMDAVLASQPDTPFDTQDPLFQYGHGLYYANTD